MKKERFFFALCSIWLAERRWIEQGFALLNFRFGWTPRSSGQFTRATVRMRFSEAGPTAFGGCGYAASRCSALHLALRVAERHAQTRLVRLRRCTLLADGGAQDRHFPGGPGRDFLRLGPLNLVQVALWARSCIAPERDTAGQGRSQQTGVCFTCSCAGRTCPASRSQGSLSP